MPFFFCDHVLTDFGEKLDPRSSKSPSGRFHSLEALGLELSKSVKLSRKTTKNVSKADQPNIASLRF